MTMPAIPEGFVLEGKGTDLPPPPDGFVLEHPSNWQSIATDAAKEVGRQVGLTARAGVKGVAALPGMGADAINSIINLGIDAWNKQTGQNIRPQQMTGPMLDHLMTTAGLPEPKNATERVVQDATGAMASVAPVAKAAEFVSKGGGEVTKRVAAALAENPAAQVTSAAGSGAAAGTARESGLPVLAQMAAGLGGGVVAGGASILAQQSRLGNAARGDYSNVNEYNLQKLSQEHDVPLSFGDIRKGAIAPKIETTLEQTPIVGMGGFREAQHAKALTAASKVVSELDDTGESWAHTAQSSLMQKAKEAKATAKTKYDALTQTADALGEAPAYNALMAIDQALSHEGGAVMKDQGLITLLTKVKDELSKGGNFSRLRDFRSDLGKEISSYYTGKNAIVGEKGVGVLQSVRSALDADMESFAKQQGGDVYEQWKGADSYYKNNVVPLREESLVKLAKTLDPDDLYRRFLTTAEKKPETLYAALGSDGQSAIRYGMVKEAFDGAMNGEGTKFSPAKFAKYLEDRQRGVGVFFKGEAKNEIDGFTTLMRHAERAGQYMENPPTGNRLTTSLLLLGTGAGIHAAPGATVAATGGALALRALLTTKAGKDLLLAAAGKTPGSKELTDALSLYGPAVGAEVAQLQNRGSAQSQKSGTEQQEPNAVGQESRQ